MQQVTQNYKTGELSLHDVEMPALRPGGVIVRSAYSVISVGTEGTKVREAKMSYLEKARARPDQVKKVIDAARNQGLVATYNKVMNHLDSLSPLGYSLSGHVVAVGEQAGEFEVGQQVACAGAGIANHAQLNFVPKNLVVPVPGNVPLDQAAFATIGAIALHGFRQSEIKLGETAVVCGLGLIGQVLVRILKAAGARVFGVDLQADRCEMAMAAGAEACGSPDDPNWEALLKRATDGAGADCVLLTVGSNHNGPLEMAARVCRDRGRVVCVGKTKLDLDYNTFFRKEIDVRFSRSYGPGRYDPEYEQKGHDYPIGYVRWTERRNLSSFLELIDKGAIDLAPIITHKFDFANATEAFSSIQDKAFNGVGVVLTYDADAATDGPSGPKLVSQSSAQRSSNDVVRIGAIGLGNYASSMLMPHLQNIETAKLAVVATATPLSAANGARKFGFERQSTDHTNVLGDDTLDAIMIATRHSSHASLVAEALASGKSVFVEKPLAIDEAGMRQVLKASRDAGNERLMVGFNRRYSKIVQDMKARVTPGPKVMMYRVHAGALPADSWLHDPEQGSRFVGEAGHFLDVFAYLTDADPISVSGHTLHPASTTSDDLENASITVRYSDGSVGCLSYLTQGGRSTPKERLEVSGGGETLVMDNFARLDHYQVNGRTKTLRGYGGAKGQKEEMAAFARLCRTAKANWEFDQTIKVNWLTLLAETAAREGRTIEIGSIDDLVAEASA